MRITRDTLMKLARNAVAERVYRSRDIICVYLTGSMLKEEPLLGGAADIDMVLVHSSTPEAPREVIQATNEVHIDLCHLSQAYFNQPRKLRKDAWVGGFMCASPLVLHDQQHWFEFTQASVCSQYNAPENVMSRAWPMAEAARTIWFDLHAGRFENPAFTFWQYLRALEKAANAVSILAGLPLTERRFMLEFPARAQALQRPGLASGLTDLFMPAPLPADRRETLLSACQSALEQLGRQPDCPAVLLPQRRVYYLNAVDALWNEQPAAAAWILLRVWTRAVCSLAEPAAAQQTWQTSLADLGLNPADMDASLAALDAYLDGVEETLDTWAAKNGIERA
ncbi:hypothetical protein ADN00_01595 [Ornatilinea apprima]|uniref:Polymerase nucleotidyl transferase domain-containing protein n=1 Tax=Ornatilinea apprima TaxID=1134406 RepID=A0A0P6XVB5_9CHLR|nr:hypothetical protein [Ornatilinea apprima]KPL80564.1 hypothetical protein ADN00_01595 [Ornatilinea apprima]